MYDSMNKGFNKEISAFKFIFFLFYFYFLSFFRKKQIKSVFSYKFDKKFLSYRLFTMKNLVWRSWMGTRD